MKNKEYWQKRFDLLQAQQLNKGIEFYHNLSEQYDKAAASVQKEIEAFYQRFAKNNGLDLFEAKKLLNSRQLKEFRWNVAEYIEKGKTLNYSDKWAKELENASIRYRVTRLEALKLQMQQQVENLIGNEVDGLDNLTRQIYEDGYYQTIFELQKGTGVTSSFSILDADKIKKILSKPWASDGLDFSRRVWGQHRAELVQKLNTDFVQALIRGDDSQKLINKISSDFNVSKYKAGRLVMTESAFFATESQKDAFKELGVKYFSVSATFDRDTCSDCGYREGEKIPMDLYEVGVTAPPFHPNCRCDIVPEDTYGDIKSYRAARDKNGNYIEVPNDMSYMQWKKKFVDENNLQNNKNKSIINAKLKNTNEVTMNLLPNYENAVIPEEKLINYALDESKNFDKAIAFKKALGYDNSNYQELIRAIKNNINKFPTKKMPDLGYGVRYQVILKLTGPNGKNANVLTAWIIDAVTQKTRLTSIYVVDKKRGEKS